MKEIKYLLDENVDPNLRSAIHHQWPDVTVWIIGDPGAPQRGTLDPDILQWCEANQFVLVTNNRASMPVHLCEHLAAEGQASGIFILNPEMSMGESAAELILISQASGAEEYMNHIHYLPIS